MTANIGLRTSTNLVLKVFTWCFIDIYFNEFINIFILHYRS